METVQQHEWKGWQPIGLGESHETCKHCGCIKVWDAIEGISYITNDGSGLISEEPPCIARTKQQEDGKTQNDT